MSPNSSSEQREWGLGVNTGDSQQREKHRPGGLAVAEVSPALAEVAGLAASASATWSLSTASSKEREKK